MRKKALFIFLMMLAIMLTSCASGRKETCSGLLSGLLAVSVEEPLKNGQIYRLGAEEGSIEYLSDDMKRAMYGDKALEHYFSRIEDCAIYLSVRAPEELAVFKCYSCSDTDIIVRMCLERADSLKVALRDTQWREKSESIRVTVHRHFVVLSFTDAPDKVEERFKALV